MVDANPSPARSSASGQLILCVCHANVCRSPMMAFLTGHLFDEHGFENSFVVDCAGTRASDGEHMCEVAAAHVESYPCGGEFVHRHRARRMSRDLVDEAGLILVASSRERAAVAGPSQDARPKTFTMLEAAQLAHAAAERSTSPYSPQEPLTLTRLGASMREQRESLGRDRTGPGRRGPLSRIRRRSLDVPDVHLGEVRSHAPAVESLEWASALFVQSVGRLAGH